MVRTVEYTRKIRLSDALYGTKFVLHRNSRNLEVMISPRIRMVDVVMWEYCNLFIGKVSELKPHFESKFGFFVRS